MKDCTRCCIFLLSFLFVFSDSPAQLLHNNDTFTHQDTLRGSLNAERDWWDVVHYQITVNPDFPHRTLTGSNKIRFRVTRAAASMQIDLQEPMQIDAITCNGQPVPYGREGNVFHVRFGKALPVSTVQELDIHFSGKPREAVKPPWDGGWIWKTDAQGSPWMSVACQGLGASVWYPCKDYQGDEPDSGAVLAIVAPDSLTAVGNGRLRDKQPNGDGTSTWTWQVRSPINNYNIVPYIGKYVNFSSVYEGENGPLDCSYWVLDYDLDKARRQFPQATSMLKCFEFWFGPYPFYADSYKLVEAPHLGMEHQSAVAYGNHFGNGYLGHDLSGSGWGMKWDFIIIHESAHEWFANNITSKDLADMWIHESFANYSETLYTDCLFGNEAGDDYVIGTRKNITNATPVIGPYGVNREGSGDMYYKGGNMLHNIRQVINNDSVFRKILRALNKTFYHQTVTTAQVESFISRQSKIDFSKVFDQYLRTVKVPVLEYEIQGKQLSFRWSNCVPGFNMPVKVLCAGLRWLRPTDRWQRIQMPGVPDRLTADRNFYIQVKNAGI